MKRLIYSCYFVYLCAKLIENRQFLFGMQLFYAPDFTPPTHTLDEQESKHCIRVLRLGTGDTVYQAYMRAYESDPVSVFGGILAINGTVDKDTATAVFCMA